MKKLIKIIATCFGIGYAPLAQGTLASLAGVGIYLLVYNEKALYILITCLLIAVGFPISSRAERIFGKKDSKRIVIDDLTGILVTYLFIPFRIPYIIAGFLIYRLLDVIKLYPLNRLERLPAGWGIMLDDLAAGLYANIILQVIARIYIS